MVKLTEKEARTLDKVPLEDRVKALCASRYCEQRKISPNNLLRTTMIFKDGYDCAMALHNLKPLTTGDVPKEG